jgi:hypothetical protein
MQDRTSGPYLAAINRILISVTYGLRAREAPGAGTFLGRTRQTHANYLSW